MIAHSKITAQGQISVPAEVRRKLGLAPGSVLEWDEEGDKVVVRRAGRYSSEEIHRVLFSTAPKPRTFILKCLTSFRSSDLCENT